MPRIFFPPQLRKLTGVESAEVDAGTVRAAIDAAEEMFPGVKAQLCDGDQLKTGVNAVVNGSVSARGLLQKVEATDEVHFLPVLGGG